MRCLRNDHGLAAPVTSPHSTNSLVSPIRQDATTIPSERRKSRAGAINRQRVRSNRASGRPSVRTVLLSALSTTPATLSVRVAAVPAATYQWFRNGSPIAGAVAATLTLGKTDDATAATYTVTATNTSGRVTSAPVRVRPSRSN